MVSKAPAEEDRAVLVGDHHGLLGGQLEGAVGRVVDDVAAGRLVAEPFPDVALGGTGAFAPASAEVIGPAPAIALYRPSRSPRCSSSPEMAAPMSTTACPTNASSFASSMAGMSMAGMSVSVIGCLRSLCGSPMGSRSTSAWVRRGRPNIRAQHGSVSSVVGTDVWPAPATDS